MATLFASLKIVIAYFYLRTPKTLQLKFLDFLHRTEISAILVKFGCHGNSLVP